MMRAVAVVALALGLASCVSSTPTDVSVTTYQVSGTSISALQNSSRSHGPRVPGLNGRAFASVETTFLHSFEPTERNGRCRFNRNGKVGLRSEVTVPEWRERDMARATPETREQFELLQRYALIHEAGHIRISQRFARQLEQVYRTVSAPNCNALEGKIEDAAQDVFRQHRAAQDEFDRTDAPRFRRFLNRYGYDIAA